MKKILFVLSLVALVSYGCNRNEEPATDTGTGMQQEESRDMDTVNEAPMRDTDVQEPEMQEDETMRDGTREEYNEEGIEDVPATEP